MYCILFSTSGVKIDLDQLTSISEEAWVPAISRSLEENKIEITKDLKDNFSPAITTLFFNLEG